jgi:hypothetical protein
MRIILGEPLGKAAITNIPAIAAAQIDLAAYRARYLRCNYRLSPHLAELIAELIFAERG